MIKSIELNGFKSFVSDTIDLGHLTLLTGLNSSGKSSIIQSVLLLEKASKGVTPFLEGHGNIKEAQNPYTTDITIEGILDDDTVVRIDYTKPSSDFSSDFDSSDFNSDSDADYEFKVNLEGKERFPKIIYIAADRFGSETSVPIDPNSNELGKRGENLFRCIDAYAGTIIPAPLKHEKSEGDTFLFNLKAWLSIVSPNAKLDYVIQSLSDSSYSTFNGRRAKNVGFGLSYTLSVITALLMGSVTKNSLVIIENPEAHLHPKGQTEIARLISLCAEAGTQVLIETHSDHLFDGIRIFTKNSLNDFHKKAKIYWCELDKNANTDIQEAVLDKNGRVDNWPSGMFDQFEINASKLL